MTSKEVQQLMERVKLQHDIFNAVPLKWEIRAEEVFTGPIMLFLISDVRVPDRNRDRVEIIHVTFSCSHAIYTFQRPHEVLWFVRNHLKIVLEHELDEMFLVNGKRLKDPHELEPPLTVITTVGAPLDAAHHLPPSKL